MRMCELGERALVRTHKLQLFSEKRYVNADNNVNDVFYSKSNRQIERRKKRSHTKKPQNKSTLIY